jgi:hypothetical protein
VSWALNDGTRKINVIRNWPDLKAPLPSTSNKVPTVVTYNIGKPEKVLSWGFAAIRGHDRQHESEPFEWFKLLLQPENLNENGAVDILELTTLKHLLKTYGKTAEDVTVDYLVCIWGHTKKLLRKQLDDKFMAKYHVRVIFTIPTIWELGSRNKIKVLAARAGLPEDIHFVQEPEAAAMEVLKGWTQLKVEDIITVCDAGGGACVRCSFHLKKR